MKFLVLKTENWKEIDQAMKTCSEVLNVDFDSQLVNFDIKDNSNYETKTSLSWLKLVKTTSIKPEVIYNIGIPRPEYDGYVLMCDKTKSKESSSLYGQHTVYNGKHVIEIYAYKGSKNKVMWGYPYTTYNLIHEVIHALDYRRGVKADVFHAYLKANQTLDLYIKCFNKTLLSLAKEYLGKDASPNDVAPDSLGCSDSVSTIIKQILPDFPIIVSTAELFKYLDKDKRFQRTTELTPGNILISPTGYGNGSITGHTGIIGEDCIYSNNSNTGLWDKHFTIKSWVARYRTQGKLPLYVFKLL